MRTAGVPSASVTSWTRPTYAKLIGRKASDKSIERQFRRYGHYSGLAFWLYLTKNWIND